jgi:hypothetical protein
MHATCCLCSTQMHVHCTENGTECALSPSAASCAYSAYNVVLSLYTMLPLNNLYIPYTAPACLAAWCATVPRSPALCTSRHETLSQVPVRQRYQPTICPLIHASWACMPSLACRDWMTLFACLVPCPALHARCCLYSNTNMVPHSKTPPAAIPAAPTACCCCHQCRYCAQRCNQQQQHQRCNQQQLPSAPVLRPAVRGLHDLRHQRRG